MTSKDNFTTKIFVKPELMAPPAGHVHHADVFRLLEEAREAYLNSIGLAYLEMLHKGFQLVITSIDSSFRRELVVGDYTFVCEEPLIRGRKVEMFQEILDEEGRLVICATLNMVFMCTNKRRVVRPPAFFMEALNPDYS